MSQQLAPPPCPLDARFNPRAAGSRLAHIVGIGGTGSNAGKTTLAEELVRLLHAQGLPVAALKTTRAHDGECPIGDSSCLVCSTAGSSFRIVSDQRLLAMKGKDTGRYVAAGAAPVRWLITNPQSVAAGVRAVLEQINTSCILVAEGNSFCDFVEVDQLVLVCGALQAKPSTSALLPRVSAFVGDKVRVEALRSEARAPQGAPHFTAAQAPAALLAAIPEEVLARLKAGL